MTCGNCGATVPEGEDRCRKCLRRTALKPFGPEEPPSPATAKEARPPVVLSKRRRVVRAVLALVGVLLVLAVLRILLRGLLAF